MWWTAIDTESVSDSGSSITVLVVSLSLVALGVSLLGVTVWFWRLTRPDPDALGPLVVMSEPDFFRRGPIDQRRSLDEARPGAVVIEAPISVAEYEAPSDPEGDVELDQEPESGVDSVKVFDVEIIDDEVIDIELFDVEVFDDGVEAPTEVPTEIPTEMPTEVADDDDRRAPIDPLL
jgi:hypothetical protein